MTADPRAAWLQHAIDAHAAIAALPLPDDPDERAWRSADLGGLAAGIAAVQRAARLADFLPDHIPSIRGDRVTLCLPAAHPRWRW